MWDIDWHPLGYKRPCFELFLPLATAFFREVCCASVRAGFGRFSAQRKSSQHRMRCFHSVRATKLHPRACASAHAQMQTTWCIIVAAVSSSGAIGGQGHRIRNSQVKVKVTSSPIQYSYLVVQGPANPPIARKLLGSIGFVFLHPKLVQDILKSCPESRAINLPDFAEGVPKLGWKSLRCSRGAGTERTRSVDKNGLDLANGELKGVRESILRLVWWPGRSTKTSLSDSLSDGMINPSLSSKASERRSAISSLWDRQLKKVRLSETKRQSAKSS